ncbi:hypothetical protein [Streptomyces triticisoli]|uniref:hypothetical protein n=1 Tax=Streptomyces triticisoli TaxID=2182797 RepID=UPI0018E57301|nr:hypothetical protein [Streptomyces triticisoli]
MARTPPHETHFTVRAARTRDGLDDRRRTTFDRGVALLARDPFPSVSRPAGSTGPDRTIRLTEDILVRYTVSRTRLLILAAAVLDDEDVLVTGDRPDSTQRLLAAPVGNDKTTIALPRSRSSTRVGEYRLLSST